MKGSFEQNLWGLGLDFSYDWQAAGQAGTVVTPFVTLRYTNLSQDGFSERGNLGLDVEK